VAETLHQTIREAKEERKRTGEALEVLVDPQLFKENTVRL
jgi:hypothetical protein